MEDVIEQPQVDEVVVADDSGAEYETQAREQGWVPQDEYKGDPKRWKSAKEFVEFGEQVTPILKKQRDEFRKELGEVKAKFEAQQKHIDQLLDFRTKQVQQEYEAQITFLKQQIRTARREGDDDTLDALESQLEKVQEQKPQVQAQVQHAQAQQAQAGQEAFNEWREENAWFEKDMKATRYALGIAQEVRQKNPALSGKAFFAEVSKQMKEDMPEIFETKPKKPAMVEGASMGASTSSRKGYNDLPADAKSACDDFVSDKLGTREDYLKLYFGK